MTSIQRALADQLQQAVAGAGTRRVIYKSEYLGYLPFGQYHWIVVGDKDISLACPDGWSRADVEALVDAGVLNPVSHWTNPQDECEQEWQYDLA